MHIKDEAPVVEIDLFKNNCEKKQRNNNHVNPVEKKLFTTFLWNKVKI